MNAIPYDPLDPAVRRDPYPCYAALRRDAPVYRVPSTGFFAVSRYHDLLAVLRRPDLFSSAAMAAAVHRPTQYVPEQDAGPLSEAPVENIIGTDPPAHTRLRTVVNRGFTPARIGRLEPRIREIARSLVDGLDLDGGFDLVDGYATPFPVTVIAELLGIDPAHRDDFRRWSDASVRAAFDQPKDDAEAAGIGRCLVEMSAHLDLVMAARERQPEDDLISTLLRKESGEGSLTRDEMKVFTSILLVAGNVTTRHLIANGVIELLRHPDQLAEVAARPALVPSLVEETLRYAGPVQLLLRTTTRDVELAGTKIPEGAIVAPLFASANRDAAAFPDADRFLVARNPKDHLAFGHGVHFCLGAALARLEARIAFETLLARAPRLALLETELEWVDSLIMRGPKRLRISVAAAR
jgi:cytochrome P450